MSVFDAPAKKLPVGSGSAGGLTVPEIVAAQPPTARAIATTMGKNRAFMGPSQDWRLGTQMMPNLQWGAVLRSGCWQVCRHPGGQRSRPLRIPSPVAPTVPPTRPGVSGAPEGEVKRKTGRPAAIGGMGPFGHTARPDRDSPLPQDPVNGELIGAGVNSVARARRAERA